MESTFITIDSLFIQFSSKLIWSHIETFNFMHICDMCHYGTVTYIANLRAIFVIPCLFQ